MRRFAYPVIVSCALGALALVPAQAVNSELPVRVCVSVLPQAYLADRVGGDRVAVASLTEAGQSPHTFEPTPALVARLSSSHVCFSIDLPFEATVLRDLRAANPRILIVDSSAGIDRQELHAHEPPADHPRSGTHGEGPDHTDHGSLDPHVWLSPANAVLVASNIRDGLIAVDPEGADDYDANLAALVAELSELDSDLEAVLRPLAGRSVYVFHPAFGYLARAYGLVQVAIEVDGKEPGARDLAEVVSRARDENVSAVFVQPQHPAGIASTVAREIGAELVTLDPLAYDCVSEMRAIGAALARALGTDGSGHGTDGEGSGDRPGDGSSDRPGDGSSDRPGDGSSDRPGDEPVSSGEVRGE